jgi:CBS domain containing-hemolysin-like protein
MYFVSPVAYPIAVLLDSWLGVHHGTTYRRTELKTLVSLHQMDGIGELTDDEVTIIASVLDLKEKSVSQIMTPLEDVFTLSEDEILDERMMEQIVSAGYSRIPIYRYDNPYNFIGMLLVKRLITYDPEDHIAVREFPINSLPEVPPNTSCLDILNFFQEGRSHMAMVTSEPGGFGDPVGVITLEDVIEELIGEVTMHYITIPILLY